MAQQSLAGQHVSDLGGRADGETEGGGHLVAEQALGPDPGVELGQLRPAPGRRWPPPRPRQGRARRTGARPAASLGGRPRGPAPPTRWPARSTPPPARPAGGPPIAGSGGTGTGPSRRSRSLQPGRAGPALGTAPRRSPHRRERGAGWPRRCRPPPRSRPPAASRQDRPRSRAARAGDASGSACRRGRRAGGKVAADDEVAAGEHVVHDGTQRPGKKVGDDEGSAVAGSATRAEQRPQVGGELLAAEVGEMIEGLLEAGPGLGSVQLAQVLLHRRARRWPRPPRRRTRRNLADRETAAATAASTTVRDRIRRSARGRGGGSQDAVDLDPVVPHREGADAGQGRERLVGRQGADGGDLRRGRTGVEPLVLVPVGGDVRLPETPAPRSRSSRTRSSAASRRTSRMSLRTSSRRRPRRPSSGARAGDGSGTTPPGPALAASSRKNRGRPLRRAAGEQDGFGVGHRRDQPRRPGTGAASVSTAATAPSSGPGRPGRAVDHVGQEGVVGHRVQAARTWATSSRRASSHARPGSRPPAAAWRFTAPRPLPTMGQAGGKHARAGAREARRPTAGRRTSPPGRVGEQPPAPPHLDQPGLHAGVEHEQRLRLGEAHGPSASVATTSAGRGSLPERGAAPRPPPGLRTGSGRQHVASPGAGRAQGHQVPGQQGAELAPLRRAAVMRAGVRTSTTSWRRSRSPTSSLRGRCRGAAGAGARQERVGEGDEHALEGQAPAATAGRPRPPRPRGHRAGEVRGAEAPSRARASSRAEDRSRSSAGRPPLLFRPSARACSSTAAGAAELGATRPPLPRGARGPDRHPLASGQNRARRPAGSPASTPARPPAGTPRPERPGLGHEDGDVGSTELGDRRARPGRTAVCSATGPRLGGPTSASRCSGSAARGPSSTRVRTHRAVAGRQLAARLRLADERDLGRVGVQFHRSRPGAARLGPPHRRHGDDRLQDGALQIGDVGRGIEGAEPGEEEVGELGGTRPFDRRRRQQAESFTTFIPSPRRGASKTLLDRRLVATA